MRIGAILTLALEDSDNEAGNIDSQPAENNPPPLVTLDVLGASVLQRFVAKLQALGVRSTRVLSEIHDSSQLLPSRADRTSPFIEEWEAAVSDYVQGGADALLLARISSYHELDVSSLLHFHAETKAILTQAYGRPGSLDIAVVDAKRLRVGEAEYRRQLSGFLSQQKRFVYSGYMNRLGRTADLHTLMQGGLTGTCGLRPVGTEISTGVWVGDDAHIDPTALILSPVYVGARSRVAASCTVAGISSIERDCKIDCGTEIRSSLVLPGTYVGVGLDVRRAIARDRNIFHVDRNVSVKVSDSRLIGSHVKSSASVGNFASMLQTQNQSGVHVLETCF